MTSMTIAVLNTAILTATIIRESRGWSRRTKDGGKRITRPEGAPPDGKTQQASFDRNVFPLGIHDASEMTVAHSGSNVRFTERQGAKSKSAMAQQSSRRNAGSTRSPASDKCFVMLKVNDAPNLLAVEVATCTNLSRMELKTLGHTVLGRQYGVDVVLDHADPVWRRPQVEGVQTLIARDFLIPPKNFTRRAKSCCFFGSK